MSLKIWTILWNLKAEEDKMFIQGVLHKMGQYVVKGTGYPIFSRLLLFFKEDGVYFSVFEFSVKNQG